MFFEIRNQTQPKPDPNRTKPKRTGTSCNFNIYIYIDIDFQSIEKIKNIQTLNKKDVTFVLEELILRMSAWTVFLLMG